MTGSLIGSLAGPLHAEMAALEGAVGASTAGKELEDQLLFVDDIKRVLPRGFSAVVLVATPEHLGDPRVLLGFWFSHLFIPATSQVVDGCCRSRNRRDGFILSQAIPSGRCDLHL